MRTFLQAARWLIIGATLIYCTGLLALVALWSFLPAPPWWLALANLFALLLFAPLLLCLLAALFIRSSWMRAAVIMALMLFLTQFGALLLPPAPPAAAGSGGTAIRVMTFNQLFTNQRAADIVEQVRAQNPDLVGFQEFSRSTAREVQQQLISSYPYQYLKPGNQSGLGLISRYPLLSSGNNASGHGQRVTMQVNGQTITLINIHLSAPAIEAHRSRRLWQLPIVTGYDTSAPTRQIGRLAQEVDSINTPLIVIGDFNTSDREPRYATMAARMHDAFRETSWGFGFTFPDHKRFGPIRLPFPLIRIDYVWTKNGILPAATHVECNNTGADHCFLVADLRLQ